MGRRTGLGGGVPTLQAPKLEARPPERTAGHSEPWEAAPERPELFLLVNALPGSKAESQESVLTARVCRWQSREADATLDGHSRITRVLGKDEEDGELAGGIPGTEEPSGLPSMGSHRVGHD